MAIAFRSEAHAGTATAGTTLTVNKPAGTASGDVLVAAILNRRESTHGVQVGPAGWSNVEGENSELEAVHNLQIWTKVATGSEPADYTWTNTGGGAWAGAITAWSGVSNGGPIGGTISGEDTSGDTTYNHPGLTTTIANSVAVCFFGVNEGATPTRLPLTLHASSTKRAEANSTVTGIGMGVCIASEAVAVAGATGARNATGGANSKTTYAAIELIEDTGGGGGGSAVAIKLPLTS
jgi:hypothetical protein